MTEYILTASRFDQVVEWHDNGSPKRIIKHRRGDIVTDLPDSEVDRLMGAGAIKSTAFDRSAPTVVWVDEFPGPSGDSSAGTGDPGANADPSTNVEGTAAAQAPGPDASAQPRKTATAKEWQDYAVTRGLSREEADALTRAELIEKFGH